MWAEIFNHPDIQACPFVRELMLEDHNYESVYHKVLFHAPSYFQERDRTAIKTAIKEAYQRLDQELLGPQNPDALTGLDKLINLFSGYPYNDELHYFFSLNQDLLIERNMHRWQNALSAPGISMKNIARAEFTEDDFIVLPKEEDLKDISTETNFYYVKLHGSCNWRSTFGGDVMVIGVDKEDQINREPLLKLYFEIFEHVLAEGNRKLLVIGYGFGDSHVNSIIANAVKEHGLKLFVLSPERPPEFREKLTKLDEYGVRIDRIKGGLTIYEGLFGYFSYTMAEVFRSIRTPVFNLIKRSLFPEKR